MRPPGGYSATALRTAGLLQITVLHKLSESFLQGVATEPTRYLIRDIVQQDRPAGPVAPAKLHADDRADPILLIGEPPVGLQTLEPPELVEAAHRTAPVCRSHGRGARRRCTLRWRRPATPCTDRQTAWPPTPSRRSRVPREDDIRGDVALLSEALLLFRRWFLVVGWPLCGGAAPSTSGGSLAVAVMHALDGPTPWG